LLHPSLSHLETVFDGIPRRRVKGLQARHGPIQSFLKFGAKIAILTLGLKFCVHAKLMLPGGGLNEAV
jgi:hypothetical protein